MSEIADKLIDNFNTASRDAQKVRSTSNLELFMDAWNSLSGYIEGLESRITELEAAQRWIPVSERLPKNGKVVHVIDMNDTGGHLCNLYETAMLVEVSGNKRFGFIGHSGWDTSDVTHWMYAMPLPEPSEVQE